MRSENKVPSELISVCICTFRRPKGLKAALISVANQKLPANLRLEIIVVDNDSIPSAREVYEQFLFSYPTINIKYFNETTSGVSFARNRCLHEASGQWVAFLDDDEEACEDWVKYLFGSAIAHTADAVFGPVLPIYDSPVPDWITANRIHDRARYATGAIVDWKDARTGNVMMNRRLIQIVGGFDCRMATTGGEDSLFFASGKKAGAALVWCDEAEIYETVPRERLTLKWAVQRSFHGGRTFSRLNAALFGPHVYVWWGLHGLLVITALVIPTFGLWLFRKPNWVTYFRKMAGGAGKVVAPFFSAGVYSQRTSLR